MEKACCCQVVHGRCVDRREKVCCWQVFRECFVERRVNHGVAGERCAGVWWSVAENRGVVGSVTRSNNTSRKLRDTKSKESSQLLSLISLVRAIYSLVAFVEFPPQEKLVQKYHTPTILQDCLGCRHSRQPASDHDRRVGEGRHRHRNVYQTSANILVGNVSRSNRIVDLVG